METGASPRGGLSTPLLPEVVPKIDVNPVSFYSVGGKLGGRSWGLRQRPRYRLAHRVLAMYVHPTFLTWRRPCMERVSRPTWGGLWAGQASAAADEPARRAMSRS